MFYKKIEEQTEPGSAFLKYLEAQILKIPLLSTNHIRFDLFAGLPQKTLDTALVKHVRWSVLHKE